jgi:hypothetical protein
MKYVPVISKIGKPLMPCHAARARQLVRKGKAVRRFKKGLFYIQLTEREDGEVQQIACGIDPGSKKEGITVKSEAHTYINIQADAVTHVSDAVKTKREMRRGRRHRKTPCRKNRQNRKRGGIPPSTKARWQAKLRIAYVLRSLYPICTWVVEDICARTKGQRRWDASFSPLQVGKAWFYEELGRMGVLITKQGYETKALRDELGLKKSSRKMAEIFEAHCVDSWVLAWDGVGGRPEVDDKSLICVSFPRYYRRKLHVQQPSKGGKRRDYGGTVSMGLKRGMLVKHLKWGISYVGGTSKNRVSLHELKKGKRLCRNAKPQDCEVLAYNSWKIRQV